MEPLSDSNFRKLLRTKQFPYATNITNITNRCVQLFKKFISNVKAHDTEKEWLVKI